MFYVYKWFIIDTNEIFYIGKGCNNRAKSKSGRNKLFQSYIAKYKCSYEILKYFNKEEDALVYEKQLISELKSKGLCKCNLDAGGKGGYHFVWTDELRDYMSKHNGMKSQKQRDRMSKFNPMKNPEISAKVANKNKKQPVIANKCYKDIQEASHQLKVSECTIRCWCNTGINSKQEICHWLGCEPKNGIYSNKHYKAVIYKNKEYKNKKSFYIENGISRTTASYWLKRGFDTVGNVCRYKDDNKNHIFIKRITSSKPITINNKHYSSVTEAARCLGIKETALHYHLHNNTGRYNFKYDNQ